MRALYCVIIGVPVLAWKEIDCHVILLFCRSPSFEKIYVDALKEFILFH